MRGERFYWGSLRAAMDKAGMTRETLATHLGVGEHSVYHWLYGEFVPPLTKFRELVTILSGDQPGGEAFRSLAADLMTDAPEQTRRQMRAQEHPAVAQEHPATAEERPFLAVP